MSPREIATKAAEAANLLAESVRTTHQLDEVIVELRTKLRRAEEEVSRLTNELRSWKS